MQLGFPHGKIANHGRAESRRNPLGRHCLAFDSLENRWLLTAGELTISMYADQTGISPGQTAGFTITIENDMGYDAQGVGLGDSLPNLNGYFLNWQIDTSRGNQADFVISGLPGSQALSLAPSISTLPAAEAISVHIVAQTQSFGYGKLLNTATTGASNQPST